MSERQLETESLTKAIYHLELSRQFMEDFKRTCKQEAKAQANTWLNKLSFVKQDVYCSLTEKSRELFQEEINKGDVLFTTAISEKWIRMTQEQRELFELAADGILRNELIIEQA